MALDKLADWKKVLLDKVMGCRTVERGNYYLQSGEFWRENEYHCDRCGKFFFRSQRPINEAEFWEDDSYYLLPMTDKVTDR